MTKADAKRLLDAIAGDPALIARLLNRELDPAVLDCATRLGIPVFPARWKDLGMQCSCPDWAVPCKHLAAVIYLLSREIDGNPFLVFSLRGLDLAAALQKRDVHIGKQADAVLPTFEELFPSEQPGTDTGGEAEALEKLQFSRIPDLATALRNVLPAQPTFFDGGDLREILRRLLARAAVAARRTLETGSPPTSARSLTVENRPCIRLDAGNSPTIVGCDSLSDPAGLDKALAQIEPARLADYPPEVAAFHSVRLMALHLIAMGAVVPQLHALRTGAVGLYWLPATLDSEVRLLMQHLADALPAGLVSSGKAKKRRVLTREGQAKYLCALFLNAFIRQSADAAREKPVGDKTMALFFGKGPIHYDAPGEGSIPGGIYQWLSRYHLTARDYAPVLCLDEGRADQFALELAVESRSAVLEKPVPMAAVLQEANWSQARFGILQTVSLLSEFFPPLNNYLRTGAGKPIKIASEALPDLIFKTLPVIRLLGIRILMPKALEQLLRPRLSMQIKGQPKDGGGFLSAGDIFSFDWKVAVGDHLLSPAEFEKLVKAATGIVRFKGEFIYLDPAGIEHLRNQLSKPPKLSAAELLRVALADEYAGATVKLDVQARKQILKLAEYGDVPLPSGINATLRPYQQRGYAWLVRNACAGFGSVLADDMGLGKTLQVIAAIQRLKEDGKLQDAKALVIVPSSLLTNWQKEVARFAPGLSVDIFHGSKRELQTDRPDILLTTYGIVRSAPAGLKALKWEVVVVDEAQNIKNPATAQTKAVKTIPAATFIAMSGTPVENRLSEYWSIMDFANRGYLGNLTQFVREYATPIQTDHNQQIADRFKRVTAPFLLRRLKTDKSIISDLPDKIVQDQYCTLSSAQTALYESVVQEGLKTISGESDTFKRQGLVLQMILALKQICNHPAHYLKQGKADASASGKVERFLELVDDIYASHEKVLVFTQFREMGTLLGTWLEERHGHAPLFLHGGVTRARRDAMVERFQNDRTERVFLLSLKAGGTGLNLTAASNVIHFDLWWNPAVEAQATDRAYRIGQYKNVQVHRMITRATFEERINDMIQAKKELAEMAVGTGETWIGNLSGEELKDLFSLGR
ncbi:DEAD/DEAH box helicase [Syntrophus gentianae]|nr:DEAD/DEAH box helicase [Syntrophus gentianae]